MAEQGDELRRRAEALAAHLHLLRPGLAQHRGHRSPHAARPWNWTWIRPCRRRPTWRPRSGGPARPSAAAASWPNAWTTPAARCSDLARAVAAADDLPADPPLDRLAALLAWRDAGAGLIPAGQSGRVHAPEEPARPFRRYLLDGRWEVWIGRSNTENDELTHRASHAQDIWLHAQGVAGSHVILRTGGKPEQVPRAVIVKAAALAALHSKAKHSGLVPVIWTERRYVRKPRKAPAGTAVCLREQSVFATPGVPDGAVPI